MNKPLLIFLAVMSASAFGQSKLPPCQGTDETRWHMCAGTSTWARCDKYVGAFKDDKRNGQGTFTFNNGDKYVGEFKEGKLHGIGTEVSPTGVVLRSGRWADGIFSTVVTQPTAATKSDPKTLAERAKQGNAQAQFEYGLTFISETNVEIQPRIALKWFSAAAKQGHGPAERQIASMFDLGVTMSVMESPIRLKYIHVILVS